MKHIGETLLPLSEEMTACSFLCTLDSTDSLVSGCSRPEMPIGIPWSSYIATFRIFCNFGSEMPKTSFELNAIIVGGPIPHFEKDHCIFAASCKRPAHHLEHLIPMDLHYLHRTQLIVHSAHQSAWERKPSYSKVTCWRFSDQIWFIWAATL